MKLESLLTIESGTLVSRLTSDPTGATYYLYDQAALGEDQGKYMKTATMHKPIQLSDISNVQALRQGDIVINLANSESAIVSEQHDGFILPYNYCKLTGFSDIDPDFLNYWLTESVEAAQQLKAISQGATLVKKLSVQQIKEFTITLPPLEKQQRIAKVYKASIRMKYLQQQKNELLSLLLKQTLN